MFYYVPLEPYRERYTMQLSAPKTGWWERNLIKAGVRYHRITSYDVTGGDDARTLKKGVVLEPVRRCNYAMMQTTEILRLADRGFITDKDVIYFDDFWHPGFESLPYTFHQLGIKPKMYAFCHAQSVDEYDFTYPMRGWMRDFENGIGKVLDGVFVSCPSMKEKLEEGTWIPPEKIHACGHVWSTEEVMERMPDHYRRYITTGATNYTGLRKNQVVFSSRWDTEKNPRFFMQVATMVRATMPDAKFIVCTSAPKIRSNDPNLLLELNMARKLGVVEVRENLSKEEYYATLCESKVQFNCSSQDWVSYVLLEASAAGCYPIYPYYRSFPETLLDQENFFYNHLDIGQASRRVLEVLQRDDLWTPEYIQGRSWIHRQFDSTWLRMLQQMGVYADRKNDIHKVDATVIRDAQRDPFKPEDWL
jgi:glycosyltransferase involved in cell wall biosynthesis